MLGLVTALNPPNDEHPPSRAAVGVPKQEVVLHRAMQRDALRLMRPGLGRSTFLLLEPSLEFGRPDGVLITASSSALRSFKRKGLRLPSLTAAKSLMGAPTNVTSRRERSLANELRRQGWNEHYMTSSARIVHDSIALEAKMADWRKAVRQATQYRLGTARTAIIVPNRVSRSIRIISWKSIVSD